MQGHTSKSFFLLRWLFPQITDCGQVPGDLKSRINALSLHGGKVPSEHPRREQGPNAQNMESNLTLCYKKSELICVKEL